jgi:predicted nucleic acid-binding protein
VIVADTSVWVAALRDEKSRTARALTSLIDADEVALPVPVRVELVSGVARKDRSKLKRALTALPVLAATDETWSLIERWIEPAADSGQRFAPTDLLIAALAHEVDALVWSLDADFGRMASLKMARLYEI